MIGESYTLMPATVKVCFYNRADDYRGRLIGLFSRSKIHHCGIMVCGEEFSYLLASDKTHRARMISSERFHSKFYTPSHIIVIGKANVSIRQLENYLSKEYKLSAKAIVFWFFFLRFFKVKWRPKSCTGITCELLRLCGFKIKDYTIPVDLYKELSKCNLFY